MVKFILKRIYAWRYRRWWLKYRKDYVHPPSPLFGPESEAYLVARAAVQDILETSKKPLKTRFLDTGRSV